MIHNIITKKLNNYLENVPIWTIILCVHDPGKSVLNYYLFEKNAYEQFLLFVSWVIILYLLLNICLISLRNLLTLSKYTVRCRIGEFLDYVR